MTDDVWKREEPESPPCVKVCSMHPEEGLCVGCLRTREEIATWGGRMTPAERREVMAKLPGRAPPRIHKRRGGRQARMQRG